MKKQSDELFDILYSISNLEIDVESAMSKINSKNRDMLCEFFKFFRDNGEANIGMTIEQFVDAFLFHRSN